MYCVGSQLLFSASHGFQFSSGPIYTSWYGIEFILKSGPAGHLYVESSRSAFILSCTWSGKLFVKARSEAEETTTSLHVLSYLPTANSQLIFLLQLISPLNCLAFGLLYLLLIQGGILCFSWNLPRFLITLPGQRSKIQFEAGLVWKLIGICWQKERKMMQHCSLCGFLKWRLAWIFWCIKSFSFYTVSQGILLLPRVFSAHLRRTK